MNHSFAGKVALVTGAGSGIGLATAKAFGEAGASVVLADRREDAVRAAAEGLSASGGKALAVRCDVTDDTQVASMIDRTVFAFGRLDAAFNNAGVMQRRVDTAEISGDQPARRLELHEVRAASDASEWRRRNRQLLVDRWRHRRSRARGLSQPSTA